MTKRLLYLFLLLELAVLSGCSINKSLPENEYLYTGATLKVEHPEKNDVIKVFTSDAKKALVYPKPNKKFLGMRIRLALYNLFHSKKREDGPGKIQKLLGKPPVIYDEQITPQIVDLLENRAHVNGFFNAQIEAMPDTSGRKIQVTYQARLQQYYKVISLTNQVSDSLLKWEVDQLQDSSLIKPGQPYRLQTLARERERLLRGLRKRGFYFFQSDYFKFKADTSTTDDGVHLLLELKPEAPPANIRAYRINDVRIYPDFPGGREQVPGLDTLSTENVKILYRSLYVKPVELTNALLLRPGQQYSSTRHQNSLKRLSNMRMFKFIDIKFERSPGSDTLLDARVYLSPRPKQTIQGEVGMSVKTRFYFGPDVSLTYTNRNFLRGAEFLSVRAFGNFSFPLSPDFAYLERTGVEFTVSKPGLILPLIKKRNPENLIMRTRWTVDYSRDKVRIPLKDQRGLLEEWELNELLAQLDADSTFAPFVALNNFEFGVGFQWRKRNDIRHELNPLKFIFQNPVYEYDELRIFITRRGIEEGDNNLVLNLERMLIFKPNYIFLYDSRLRKYKLHNYFYRGRIAISGNWLLSENPFIPESSLEGQFLQLENDIRYFLRPTAKTELGFRINVHMAYPLANEVILPFFDLYSVGGANSIRAFPARLVGPGSVEPEVNSFFFTGTGNLKLESSLEWRQRLSGVIESGVYFDVGNVWLIEGSDESDPGAKFRSNTWYRQLAVGTGAGLRINLDILVVRLDFAFPLTKPWFPEGQRWVGNQIRFGSSTWRKDNLQYYLTFGYPF